MLESQPRGRNPGPCWSNCSCLHLQPYNCQLIIQTHRESRTRWVGAKPRLSFCMTLSHVFFFTRNKNSKLGWFLFYHSRVQPYLVKNLQLTRIIGSWTQQASYFAILAACKRSTIRWKIEWRYNHNRIILLSFSWDCHLPEPMADYSVDCQFLTTSY